MSRLTYQDRIPHFSNPVAKRLLALMTEKQSNLAFSADIIQKDKLLRFIDEVGPEICLLKTHIDTVLDFDYDLILEIQKLAAKHQFLIFEDRKFADIGYTAQLQYQGGVYRMADWADIINAHSLPGPGLVEGLKAIGLPRGRACLYLAQMSSANNLLNEAYCQATVDMAIAERDFVIGFIAQQRLIESPDFITMTPGISLDAKGDALGQQYNSPTTAIANGTDVLIVGRGISAAKDPKSAAAQYREVGWQAYCRDCTIDI